MYIYGRDEANKYGETVQKKLSGKYISKRQDIATEEGGLVYEADKLDMDVWDLLRTLEGMCNDGRTTEVDDSTYYVIPYEYVIEVENRYEIKTTNLSEVCDLLKKNKLAYTVK